MKPILIFVTFVIVLISSMANAEYLACDIPDASQDVVAINSQGRRSELSDPFVLKAAPSASSGHRIVEE